MTLIIKDTSELKGFLDSEIGVSNWHKVTQEQIDAFAAATGDPQWIHVDVERCRQESPFGTTIAHGFLTLSLAPMLTREIFKVENIKLAVNYGLNKVRFMSHLPAGSNIRLRVKLTEYEAISKGVRVATALTFETEGRSKPVCVAESLTIFYHH